MFCKSYQKFFLAVLLMLALRLPAQDANSAGVQTNDLRGDQLTASLLQIQEQLHNTQLAIQESELLTAALARTNSDQITAQIQSLAQNVAVQTSGEAGETHKTLEWTLLLIGSLGLAGLGILLWMVYLQSRAFAQLAKISAQQNVFQSAAGMVQDFAAPARATVENSNARLLEAVGELRNRVTELEQVGTVLTQAPKTNGTTHVIVNSHGNGSEKSKADLLAEAQKCLDEDSPRVALEILDRYLAGHPDDADALLKKADALQKVGRNDDALAHYNRVIATDGTLAVAHLQKGGLLNRLRRYDEALNCYEQALQAQEKRRRRADVA